jgi:hypothetical protein
MQMCILLNARRRHLITNLSINLPSSDTQFFSKHDNLSRDKTGFYKATQSKKLAFAWVLAPWVIDLIIATAGAGAITWLTGSILSHSSNEPQSGSRTSNL